MLRLQRIRGIYFTSLVAAMLASACSEDEQSPAEHSDSAEVDVTIVPAASGTR